jgi:hypothetical protein
VTTRPDDDVVDELVRRFGRLLASAWPELIAASASSDAGSFVQDWLQANWEMFVEGALPPGTFLEVYGEGADCNGASSRVYQPDAIPTHAVVCVPRPGVAMRDLLSNEVVEGAGLPMEELVSLDGSWYAQRPPFDCVLVEAGERTYVLSMDQIRFALGPATRG